MEENELISREEIELIKNGKDLESALKIINLLSNPVRLKMAYLLSRKELCTNDLERILGVDQTLVSHYLRAFKDMNLTQERREGRWRYYSITDTKIQDLFKAIKISGI